MEDVDRLINKLESWFSKIEKAVVALSGGIDSSLVAFAARRMLGRENVIAVISASASVKNKELNEAREFCNRYDIQLIEIDAREIDDLNYKENPVNRCFFCKSALYSAMDKLIAEKFPGHVVLNGNNFSDFGDYRPGLKAADEHHVYSPLAECEFTKDDLRMVAQSYGLPNWNKPASPCLSSRFPYGEAIDVDKLKMVEKAEDLLNEYGFEDVRVRYVKNTARVEVPADRVGELQVLFDRIAPQIGAIGFDQAEVDPEGLVSGKMNRVLSKDKKQ